MFKMMFEKSGQFFIITIENKIIKYWDKLEGKIWGGPLQYLPPDPKIHLKIEMSRNKIPKHFIHLLDIQKDELVEFENAKTDEELKELVLRDCKRNGCKLMSTKIE